MNLDLSRNMGSGDDNLGATHDDDGGDGCEVVGNRNNNIYVGLLNIRSLSPKVDKVFEIMNNGLDIFVITESWHGSSDDICVKSAMPPGFCFADFLRPHDPYHGGIIVYHRSIYRFTKIELPPLKSFEAVALRVCLNKLDVLLLAVYRPGSAPISPLFFQELLTVLEHISMSGTYMLIAGDFNLHIENSDDCHVKTFFDILESFCLSNVVDQPTHIKGGILDLIISSHNFPILSCKVDPTGIYSDRIIVYYKFVYLYHVNLML